MNENYFELLQDLKRRTNPQGIADARAILEKSAYSGKILPYSDITEYVKLSMVGVPKEYTAKSKEVAERVIGHLKRSHGNEIEIRYQGSVETNTHILSENDIDLVQITSKSNSIDTEGLRKALNESYLYTPTEVVKLKRHSDTFSKYNGDQKSDLRELRLKAERVLTSVYSDVDISKPKAICVNVKSPLRNVDVVTAVDYKSVEYMKRDTEHRKGIQVYDKEKNIKLPVEYPFWSIKRINERDIITDRRFKKMIRFLKNVKFDAKKLIGRKPLLSSFDINAICYSIPEATYRYLRYLELVPVLNKQIVLILEDANYRNSLKSVDGQEYIFRNNPEKVQELQFLKNAVDSINLQIRTQSLILS